MDVSVRLNDDDDYDYNNKEEIIGKSMKAMVKYVDSNNRISIGAKICACSSPALGTRHIVSIVYSQ
jgi:hypothetical protein